MPDTNTISVYVSVSWRAWERIKAIAELERRDPRHQAALMLERTAMASRKRVAADSDDASPAAAAEMVA